MTNSTVAGFLRRLQHHFRDDLVKYADQFHYGHADTLLESLGYPGSAYLKGVLQHGAYPSLPKSLFDHGRVYESFFREATFFAWNESLAKSWESFGGKSIVIGSPWAHLVSNKQSEAKNLEQPQTAKESRTIYFPSHGYFGWVADSTVAELEQSLLSKISLGDIEICLYWSEFLNPEIRQKYLRITPHVVCAGFRGGSAIEIPWDNSGGRRYFLKNIYNFISRSDLVVVDEISTIFWYALSLGKRIVVTREICKYHVVDEKGVQELSYSNLDVAKSFALQDFSIEKVLNSDSQLTALARQVTGFDFVNTARLQLEPYVRTNNRLSPKPH